MFANYIDGTWSESPTTKENINPSDVSDVVGLYARASIEQAHAAIEAASRAQSVWSQSTPQQRFDVLDFIGSEILARKNELGKLLAREEGKILSEGIGEVVRAGYIFKYFAGEALRISGEHISSVRSGVEIDVLRQPIGIVGLITPWNFPIAIPSWKVAPAIAFGNTVILKPAELAPASSCAVAEIISRSGLPAGVFNLVMGSGNVVGNALVTHPKVNAISFTGSVEVGRNIAVHCAQNMKKVQLEMGGKNPMVILDDADLTTAVNACINGAYFSTGQRCTATSRMIVTEKIHDRFVAAMIERLRSMRVGDALDPTTEMGPVVDEAQLEKNLEYVRIGMSEGGKLVVGGERLKLPKQGFYMSPALFTETTNEMRINREEVFGPVATVLRVKDYDEALHNANDTPFGLSAGICTSSLKHATDFKNRSQAGMVMVNLPTAGVDYHVPFGGRKGSSYGSREQGKYAIEFYTTVKTCYIAP